MGNGCDVLTLNEMDMYLVFIIGCYVTRMLVFVYATAKLKVGREAFRARLKITTDGTQ